MFTNSDIITGLVYGHTTVEPVVVQNLDEKNTLMVLTESEDTEKICNPLLSIEMWFGHSVNIGCDAATLEQVSMGDWLCQVGREETVSVEDTGMQLPRQMPELQCIISCPSLTSQVVGKMQIFSTFSGGSTQKGDLIWAMDIWSEMCDTQSHRGDTEGRSLHWACFDV